MSHSDSFSLAEVKSRRMHIHSSAFLCPFFVFCKTGKGILTDSVVDLESDDFYPFLQYLNGNF